jgi:hypothetical protein
MRKLDGGQIDDPGEGVPSRERDRGFADSPLEEDGFELPVPREKKSRNLGILLEFN